MAQDPNQQSSYGSGYGGYTPPKSASGGQSSYGQASTNQQSSQQGGYSGYYQKQQQQQQYGGYQPPLSATAGRTANDPTSTRMSARTEALLSNLFMWLGGLVFFVIERKNRFVRFHAAQSFAFFGSAFIVYYVLKLLIYFISFIPLLGGVLGWILGLVLGVIAIPVTLVWIFLMIQAFRGKIVRLPYFGDFADSLVDRFSPKQKTTV